MQFYLILTLFFALLVAIFAIQNSIAVPVKFLFWEYQDTPLVLVIFCSAILGALSVGVIGMGKQLKLNLRLKDYKHQVNILEGELENFRNREEYAEGGKD